MARCKKNVSFTLNTSILQSTWSKILKFFLFILYQSSTSLYGWICQKTNYVSCFLFALEMAVLEWFLVKYSHGTLGVNSSSLVILLKLSNLMPINDGLNI
jgi:hypothetical protein